MNAVWVEGVRTLFFPAHQQLSQKSADNEDVDDATDDDDDDGATMTTPTSMAWNDNA